MRRTGRSTARPNPARSPPGDTRPAGGRGTAEGRADGDDSRSWVRSGWARRSVSGGSAGCGRAFCPAVAELPTWAPRSDVVIPGRSLASRRVGPTLRSNANRMGCRRVFDGMSLSGSRPSWPAGWPPVSTSDRHGSRIGMDLTEPDIARIREQFDFDRSRRVELRIARFDHRTGELDLDHLASLVDSRTKLVCCSGASNFLGSKPPLPIVRAIADAGGYPQPTGERRARLLVDGAQLVPSSFVDVRALDVDYLAFSFHKLLAPFGVGVLYAKEHLLDQSLPFLYGGEMVDDRQVTPDAVGYNGLPWKYSAGTPNILGVIVSAQALRLTADLLGGDPGRLYFRTEDPVPVPVVRRTMDRFGAHTALLTRRAMEGLSGVPGLWMLGVPPGTPRSPLVAFTVAGWSPFDLAAELNRHGVESRAGCHCATLAHHDLGLDPPASCRLSFYLYNSIA